MPKLKTQSSEPKTAADLGQGGGARDQLYSFVQRAERLNEEIDGLSKDRKEVFAEAKDQGFDTAVIRKVIQRRKHNSADIAEADAILDLYETTIAAAEKAELAQSEEDAK